MRTIRRMRNGTNQQAGLGFFILVRFFNALLLLLLLLLLLTDTHLHGPHHKNNENDEKDAQWHEPTGRPGLFHSRALLQRPSSSSSFAHTHTCTGHTIRTMRTMRRMRNGTNQQAGLGFIFLVRFFNALRVPSSRRLQSLPDQFFFVFF